MNNIADWTIIVVALGIVAIVGVCLFALAYAVI